MRAGWSEGTHVAAALGAPWLKVVNRIASPLSGFLVGAAAPVALGWQLHAGSDRARLLALAGAVAVALVLRLGQRVAGGVMVAAALLGGAWLAGILLW